MSRALVAIALATCVGCGAAPRSADALANELAALDLETANEQAPDLVLAARTALDATRAAEDRGDEEEAADQAMIARLAAATAIEEAARIRLEAETLETERETLDAEAQAVTAERAATAAREEADRNAAARTARELGATALARAELDEARPARAAHLSLTEAAEVRAAAAAIRTRARLLRSAALAMGATAGGRLDDLLARSESASDPHEQLALADRAHEAARALLTEARRAAPRVDAARTASLAEAAESEGFHAITLERGTAIELEDVFSGSSTRPSSTAAGRLARLASLVQSYPDGNVIVEVDARSAADASRLSAARASSVVQALVAGGIAASRVSAGDAIGPASTPSPAVRVRVVLVAYANVPPASGGTIVPAPPAPDAASPSSPGE